MPNHITNRLEINADNDRVQEVMNFIKGKPNEEGTSNYIDFNKIIPMPKELMIEASTAGEYGLQYILAMQRKPDNTPDDLEAIKWIESQPEERRKQVLQLGEMYLSNQKQYGYPTWYEWSNNTWGTKWNAYEQRFEEPNVLWFDTAWNGVPQLIGKLSEIFPNIEFQYAYADEDLGSNTGKGSIKNGEILMTFPDDGSKEAYEIMFEIRPEMEDSFELTDDGYQWID